MWRARAWENRFAKLSCRRPCTFLHAPFQNLADPRVRKRFRSPQGWSYGYRVDQGNAVDYLLSNYPEWREHYRLFEKHWAAMTIVAADLSEHCGLTVCADSIWTGGGCTGLGMVLMGIPDVDKKLEKLEEKLVELKFVTTPKLELLCSSSSSAHLEEPFKMATLPIVDKREWNRVMEVMKHWKQQGGHDSQRQEKQKVEQEDDGTRSL